MFQINKTIRPIRLKSFATETFVAVPAAKAMDFCTADRHERIEIGTFWSLDERRDGRDVIAYVLAKRGMEIGLAVYLDTGDHVSTYAFNTEQGKIDCIEMLKQCHGRNYDEFETVKRYHQKVEAVDLYSWEQENLNGTMRNMYEVVNIPSVVKGRHKKVYENNRATPLTRGEAVELVKRIAKDYNLYNITLTFMSFNGRQLGFAQRVGHSIIERVTEATVSLCDDLLLDTTLIHEMAHVVDFYRDGESGHGDRFRENYEDMLNRYLFENSPVAIPRISGDVSIADVMRKMRATEIKIDNMDF